MRSSQHRRSMSRYQTDLIDRIREALCRLDVASPVASAAFVDRDRKFHGSVFRSNKEIGLSGGTIAQIALMQLYVCSPDSN